MILEIALGIVIAVIILTLWEVILGLSFIFMVAAIVLISAGLIVLWAVMNYESFGITLAVAGSIFLILWFNEFMSKKRIEEQRRAFGYDGSGSESGKRS